MSTVTTVVIVASLCDDDIVKEINDWLETKGFGALGDVGDSDKAGGNKWPEEQIWTGGYNNFMPGDEFGDFFATRAWDYPENAVAVLGFHEDATKVYRPERYR